jgi:hypothetical protein
MAVPRPIIDTARCIRKTLARPWENADVRLEETPHLPHADVPVSEARLGQSHRSYRFAQTKIAGSRVPQTVFEDVLEYRQARRLVLRVRHPRLELRCRLTPHGLEREHVVGGLVCGQ